MPAFRFHPGLLAAGLFGFVTVSALGCGGAAPPSVRHAGADGALPSAPPSSAVQPVPESTPGVIVRAELDAVLDRGPGAFLSRLVVEPVMEGDTFVAFQVAELADEGLFAGVDLLVGDRLVSVNGQTIERPEHAMTVWSGLRVASELSVVVLRGGERRELRFDIVD